MKNNIVHLTSAHPRYDTRIFLKMCQSLAKSGHVVSLVVADGLGDEVISDVTIVDVGEKSGGRLSRMTNTVKKVLNKAIELDADIYHLHDPELLSIARKLKRLGKTVIFDSHEDVPKQILGKPYLNKLLRQIIGKSFALYEAFICKRIDAVIAATPFIRDKFLSINPITVDINNFPILGELQSSGDLKAKENIVCYIGGISKIRGIREIVSAMEHTNTNVRLQLGGDFNEVDIENEVKTYTGWDSVDELGFLKRDEVKGLLTKSVAGLVTLHPVINYIDSLPIKMFEYMSAGIPVISSDFPLWKNIIEGNNCGLCVNPMDDQAIAKSIDFFINNPDIAKEMGENGFLAVKEQYNWGIEEKKLLSLYRDLIKVK